MKRAGTLRVAEAFLESDRERAGSAREAEKTCSRCIRLFDAANEQELRSFEPFDDALFNASFDLGIVVFQFELKKTTVESLLASISRLFALYYHGSPPSVSCGQFWDNILGYKEVSTKAYRSSEWFFAGARELLQTLANDSEGHIRASALHGMNHYPNLDMATEDMEEVLAREASPTLRQYATEALAAFRAGRRLV